jgi:uncharacterized RDD family membrane protein YckC
MEQTVQSNQAPDPQVKYAGFRLRFIAYWVDWLIIFPLGLMIQQMVGSSPFALFQAKTMDDLLKLQSSGNSLLGMAISTLFSLAFFLIFWVNYDGATPGKKLLGIKIIKDNGEKINYPSAFIRYIGYLISGATLMFFGIGYLWIIWDKKKQALHDKIAGTLVVKTDQKPRTILAIFLALLAMFIFFGYFLASFAVGFSIGMKSAPTNQKAVTESMLQENLKKNQEQDASKILSFAPSSCGLTVPIPKSTDTYKGKERKWLFEEVPLDTASFYVLDKDVFPVKEVLGSFLGYKDASSRLGGKSFSVAFPGLNIYCVNNTNSYTLDEYVSLSLANKNHTVITKKVTYWGNVELMGISLQGKDASGKEFIDSAYLGVTQGADSKLLYIRMWGVADDDPNKTVINEDLDVIVRNLKYRNASETNVKGVGDINVDTNSQVKGAHITSEEAITK